MNHCKDCKHWGVEGVCKRIESMVQVLAYDWDALSVDPDFGCILFEEKE